MSKQPFEGDRERVKRGEGTPAAIAVVAGLALAGIAILMRFLQRDKEQREKQPGTVEEKPRLTRWPGGPAAHPWPGAVHEGMPVPEPGYETNDASVRKLLPWGIGLVAGAFAIVILATLVQFLYLGRIPTITLPPVGEGINRTPPAPLPPQPRLQVEPQTDLAQFRAQEDQILNGYGWIDQKAGKVRIPISRAMQLLAQRGLPTRPADQSSGFRDQGQGLPSYSSSGRQLERNMP